MKTLYITTLLFPFLCSFLVLKTKDDKKRNIITFITVFVTSVLVWLSIINTNLEAHELLRFTKDLNIEVGYDKLGRFFAGIVSTLYPLTTLYAFDYMSHEERKNSFFFFFILAYVVTIGVTLARNFFTLYCFYELLTLTTMPLVLHTRTPEAKRASRIYLYLSIGGASLAFLSMIYFLSNNGNLINNSLTQLFYLLGFFGFAVKAAVFPLHVWLPRASAAPTPVTALLHAVAVVKSGVFAIIRLTYYIYGVENIAGSYAQNIALIFVIFTIIFGSSKAVKEVHFKRRMAYSTIANLSYILFGVLLMNEFGLMAALLHMAFHAEIKILGFFAVGSVMHNAKLEYVDELDGLGKKMPLTFICYTVSALALTGMPPLSGFVSKAYLIDAGFKTGSALGVIGVCALLISAILTAIYSLTPVRRAFFPNKEKRLRLNKYHEANKLMIIPMLLIALGILLTGLFASPIIEKTIEISSSIVRW